MLQNIIFLKNLTQLLKNVETILSSQDIQKQGVRWIWLMDSSLATSDLDKYKDHVMRKIFRFGLLKKVMFYVHPFILTTQMYLNIQTHLPTSDLFGNNIRLLSSVLI